MKEKLEKVFAVSLSRQSVSVILNKSLKTSPTGYISTRNVIRLLEQSQDISPDFLPEVGECPTPPMPNYQIKTLDKRTYINDVRIFFTSLNYGTYLIKCYLAIEVR